MMFFKKKIEECPFKEFIRDVFRKIEHRSYYGYAASSVFTEWELIKTSGRYVDITKDGKKFECLVGKEVVWISDSDLQWPKCS